LHIYIEEEEADKKNEDERQRYKIYVLTRLHFDRTELPIERKILKVHRAVGSHS
jgi:hypothetical protein